MPIRRLAARLDRARALRPTARVWLDGERFVTPQHIRQVAPEIWLFYITVVFGLLYLLAYPGLGRWGGFLGWSQADQYERERAAVEARAAEAVAGKTELEALIAYLQGLGTNVKPGG